MGIKDVKDEPARMSVTYWEAIYKFHAAYTEHREDENRQSLALILAILFERKTGDVIADLIRGVP